MAYDGDFNGLRKITGNPTRVVVTTESGFLPELQNAVLLSSENGVHEFELDLAHTPIKTLMQLISELGEVRDVEIKKAPIEQVIASVYSSWK